MSGNGIGQSGAGQAGTTPSRPDQAEFDLLAFIRRQARPDQVFGGPGARGGAGADDPAPIRTAGSSLVPLGGGEADGLLAATLYPLSAAASASRSARMRALIRGVVAFQRHEPSNAFNAHRSFPSAQSKFTAELFLGVAGSTWYYDAAWDGLRPVGTNHVGPDVDPDAEPWQALDAGADAFLAVLGSPGRLPGYYRELRWALTLCEEGHLAGLAVQVARTLGFTAEVWTGFDDRGLLHRIGAEPGDAWLPGAVIVLDGARPEFGPTPAKWPEPEDPVLTADRPAWSRADEATILAEEATPPAGPAPEQPDTDTPPSPRSWSQVLFERSSGRAPGGLTAAPEPLPAGLVDRALAAASAASADWGPLDLLVAVDRADDLADGLYAWESGKLLLRRPGRQMAAVQRAFFYPQTVTRVDTCNAAVFCVVDYPSVLAAEGPRGLRTTQLRIGALMQAAALTCAADGAFLRPCRSFGPDALTEMLDLHADQTVAYLCLIGRSRFTDLLLDLRLPGAGS